MPRNGTRDLKVSDYEIAFFYIFLYLEAQPTTLTAESECKVQTFFMEAFTLPADTFVLKAPPSDQNAYGVVQIMHKDISSLYMIHIVL